MSHSKTSHAPEMLKSVDQLSAAGLTVTGVAMSNKRGVITAIVMHNGDVHWCRIEDGEQPDGSNSQC